MYIKNIKSEKCNHQKSSYKQKEYFNKLKLKVFIICFVIGCSQVAFAAETDITQTPNVLNAGIQKSLVEQIGASRGDVNTYNSSSYIIQRDPFRAIVRGRRLFQRKFTASQGIGPRIGGSVGDITATAGIGAGLSDSCSGCHANPMGSAGVGGNIFTRPDGRDTPHLFGIGLVEMLADEMTRDLRFQQQSAITQVAQQNQSVLVLLY